MRTVPGTQGWNAELVTVGICLATPAERRAALTAACTGNHGPMSRLPGSYLALLWLDGVLTVAGDRAGVVPVYWARHGDAIWWSTVAAPLAALTGTDPRLPVLLADLTLAGVDIAHDQARYESVRRVPPGHALILRPGGDPAVHRLPVPPPLTPDEGARQLRSALGTAVGRRSDMYGTLTTDLSGGIDSSSVTCLAAARRPVLSVTYTDARLAEEDDVHYARRLAAENVGISHQIIDARRAGVRQFDGLGDSGALPVTDIPSLSLGWLAVKDAQMAPVAAHGSQAHLTGRGGDNVLTAADSRYVDQFLDGHRLAALRGATAHARAHHVAPWKVWRQLGRTAHTSYPRALESLATTVSGPEPLVMWRAARWEDLAWCSLTTAAEWLTPEGRRVVAELIEARTRTADPSVTPGALHDRLDLEFMAGSHAMYDSIARQRWNIPVHAPFLDTTVIDACHAVPAHQRVREGIYKPLAREALAGLVPDFLLHRQTKTAFTTSLYDGLAANASVLRKIVSTSSLAQAGLIDAHRVEVALTGAVAGAPAPLAALHALIVTELWLTSLQRQTARATWWQPATERSPI
ncbi:asparagine synthase-related protein [Streptomyces sp. NPDC000594]|uniref:asparagine synthase-related protein n=1 Tax=Streptomyces sp. NPDC000594 TaxID=3154261 RepID=UPI0033227042